MKAWILAAVLLFPVDALACATCVGGPWDKTDLGIFWSALFLMGVPVVVAGLIGGWLFYNFRRSRDRGETIHFVEMQKERKE